MISLIVEKHTIELTTGARKTQWALVTQQKNIHSVIRSLTWEGYLTAWNENRAEVDNLQTILEKEVINHGK